MSQLLDNVSSALMEKEEYYEQFRMYKTFMNILKTGPW